MLHTLAAADKVTGQWWPLPVLLVLLLAGSALATWAETRVGPSRQPTTEVPAGMVATGALLVALLAGVFTLMWYSPW